MVTSMSRCPGALAETGHTGTPDLLQKQALGPAGGMAKRVQWCRAMAKVLLGTVAALSSGCLVPQEDGVLPQPIFRNHTPYFVNTSPASAYIETDNCDGTRLEFRVTVADPEVDDRVTVRYYVDFPQVNQGPEYEDVLPNSQTETRQRTVDYTPLVNQLGSVLEEPGEHVVEAVVFDGTLSPDRVPLPLEVYPDAGVNPSFAAITRWVVFTVECPL